MEASFEEFSKHGYEKASIAQIIKRAGIPRGSFYQYFEDKLDLYSHILLTIGLKKHEFSTSALPDYENMNFIETIHAQFTGGIKFYREYPMMAKIANDFLFMQNQEVKARILKGHQQKSDDFFLRLIEEGKKRSEIDLNLDNETLLFMIHSLHTSFVQFFTEHCGMDYQDDSLFRYVDQMILFLKKGISVS